MSWLRRPAHLSATGLRDAERRAYEQRIGKLERELRRARDRLERHQEQEEGPAWVALNYEGAEIRLAASTKLARKRRTAATKEPFTVEWIESLPPGEVLYDVGANVGAYSLIAARRLRGLFGSSPLSPATRPSPPCVRTSWPTTPQI